MSITGIVVLPIPITLKLACRPFPVVEIMTWVMARHSVLLSIKDVSDLNRFLFRKGGFIILPIPGLYNYI